MVEKFRKENPEISEGPFKKWFQWIRLYYLYMIVPMSLSMSLIVLSFIIPVGNVHTINYFASCIFFGVVLAALFFYPSVLYGLPVWDLGRNKDNQAVNQLASEQSANQKSTSMESPSIAPKPLGKMGLSESKIRTIAAEIKVFFETKKAFLKPGFSLNDLAAELGYSTHLISAVINAHHKIRFNDLINQYRIQYVIANRRRESWHNLTLEAIALEAGFSTTATFIAAFKKQTGKTPSQYFVAG